MTKNMLTSEQSSAILAQYQPKSAINFPVLLLAVGAVVVGLGILLFIASNWEGIPKSGRMVMIVAVYGALAYLGGRYYIEQRLAGRILLYLAAFTCGAGLILVGQIFSTSSGDFSTLLLMWFLGILP